MRSLRGQIEDRVRPAPWSVADGSDSRREGRAAYRELLGAGDARGAFAAMVRGAGRAPPALERMPLWYVKLMLRPFIKERQWRQIEPLLETALAEHEQVAARDEDTVDRSQTITARVVLLGGGKSRSRFTTTLFDHLAATIPSSTCELIGGLDHKAPNELLQG